MGDSFALFKLKMTRLEQIEFENVEKFNSAITMVLEKKESFRTYKDSENKEQSKKIIGNGNLYLGNGYSLNINKSDSGKIYVSVNYFSAEDRINMAMKKKESNNV